MRKTIEEVAEEVAVRMDGRTVTSHEHFRSMLKDELTKTLQAREEALLAELEEEVKSLWEDETRLQSSVTFNHALKRVLSLISSKRMK